jgi:hypothetical protein
MSIKRFNIRFNLSKEADLKAWEYLQNTELSCNKAIITAINGYHAEQTAEELQNAFLERVIITIEQSIKSTAPVNAVGGLLQLLGHTPQVSEIPRTDELKVENDDAVLDFLDNF